MHISRLDLNLFVVLDAIYTEGNITRAAKSLNLTQPALSHALSRLRAMLNDPLFSRQGSLMMPTPLTRSLIGPVRLALKTLATSVQQANVFDPMSTSRLFNIGMLDVLEAKILPSLIHRVKAEAPGVDIASVRVERREMDAELAAGSLDLAINVLVQLPKEIHRARVLGDTPVVVVRKDHPRVGTALDLEAYLGENHIMVSSRRKGPGLEDMVLASLDRHRHVALRCQQYYAACQVVSQTDLLLTMPAHYAQLANMNLPNRVLPLPFDMQQMDIYLYWHENVDADPANLWMRELLRQMLSNQESQVLAPAPKSKISIIE